jgi:hypothetical protein
LLPSWRGRKAEKRREETSGALVSVSLAPVCPFLSSTRAAQAKEEEERTKGGRGEGREGEKRKEETRNGKGRERREKADAHVRTFLAYQSAALIQEWSGRVHAVNSAMRVGGDIGLFRW